MTEEEQAREEIAERWRALYAEYEEHRDRFKRTKYDDAGKFPQDTKYGSIAEGMAKQLELEKRLAELNKEMGPLGLPEQMFEGRGTSAN